MVLTERCVKNRFCFARVREPHVKKKVEVGPPKLRLGPQNACLIHIGGLILTYCGFSELLNHELESISNIITFSPSL